MAIDKPSRSRLLSLLDGEDVKRAEEQYLILFHKLTCYFDYHNCESPEDLASEALLRVQNALASDKPITAETLFGYCWGVAKNLQKEHSKRRRREKSDPLESHPSLSKDVVSPLQTKILIDECLKHLPPDEKELLLSNYLDGPERTAQRFDINVRQLRVKLHRIRKKIREFGDLAPHEKGMSA